MLTYLHGTSKASVLTFCIIHQMMHGLFVMCIGSAFVLCSVCFALCAPTGDGICSTVGVTVTTHVLKPENYFAVHPANSYQSESCTAY